jgi:hypothetical protein
MKNSDKKEQFSHPLACKINFRDYKPKFRENKTVLRLNNVTLYFNFQNINCSFFQS